MAELRVGMRVEIARHITDEQLDELSYPLLARSGVHTIAELKGDVAYLTNQWAILAEYLIPVNVTVIEGVYREIDDLPLIDVDSPNNNLVDIRTHMDHGKRYRITIEEVEA